MSVLAKLLYILASMVNLALLIYMWLIIIRALISWVSPDPYNPIVRFLYRTTEPVLRPVRLIIPIGRVGIDFSPLVVIIVIYLLRLFLVRVLIELATKIG